MSRRPRTLRRGRTPRLGTVLGLLLTALLALGACANLPDSTSPQALGTINREPTSTEPTPPIKGRAPDLLVRDFLAATSDPTNRHQAARQYLSPAAALNWDDAASTAIVESPDTLRESQTADTATYRIRANKVGDLDADGSYRAVDTNPADFEADVKMVKVDGEWRIDQLPPGVVIEETAFSKAYQHLSLYFPNTAGTTTVPDLRWIATPKDQLTQRLLSLLAEGPQPELAPAVRNVLSGPVTLRGGITKANGETDNVGVGLGGVLIDFAGASTLDPRSKELLAAEVVLTLSSADILGPYVLLADGKPLDDRYSNNGWSVGDVNAMNPMSNAHNQPGLNALRDGTLVAVDSGKGDIAPVPGYFGTVHNLQSAGVSHDRQLVAAVADSGLPAPAPARTLVIGSYNGNNAFPVAQGSTFTRPSWTFDDSAAWSVVNGDRVIRAVHDQTTGNVSVQDVDTSALFAPPANVMQPALRLPITELRIDRTGTRAALIAGGKVYSAVVVARPDGRYALTAPLPVEVSLSTAAVSVDWTGTESLVFVREGNVDPVQSVFIDGSDLNSLVWQNLTPPLRIVSASPDTLYIADSRAVMQFQSSAPAADRVWREVQGLGANSAPVIPG